LCEKQFSVEGQVFWVKWMWEDCTITEASRNGFGIQFYTREKIKEGSLIHFRILLPSEPNPVEVNASLRWIEQQDGYFVGGVEWFQIY